MFDGRSRKLLTSLLGRVVNWERVRMRVCEGRPSRNEAWHLYLTWLITMLYESIVVIELTWEQNPSLTSLVLAPAIVLEIRYVNSTGAKR
jgi:hypothetical protein